MRSLLISTVAVAAVLFLFYGNIPGFLIFGFFWLVQIVGAIGDPDGNKKSASAGNTDTRNK